jgi:hypothetical protein
VRCGRPGLSECFPCRFDRVQRVTLGAARSAAADAPADLDDALPVLIEEDDKTGAIRARPLDRPHPPPCRVPLRPSEQSPVTGPVGACAPLVDDTAARGEDRSAVPVAMRIDADDVVRLLCQHPSTSTSWGPSVPVWGSETAAAGL